MTRIFARRIEMMACGCVVRVKRDKLTCSKCGDRYCPKHIYSRVDESNRNITKNAPLLCWTCSKPPPPPMNAL